MDDAILGHDKLTESTSTGSRGDKCDKLTHKTSQGSSTAKRTSYSVGLRSKDSTKAVPMGISTACSSKVPYTEHGIITDMKNN